MDNARSSGDSLPRFEEYIAIDWSGAKGVHHRGIAVAVAIAGNAAPQIIPAPRKAGWARGELAEWLEARPRPALAGFDFSFAPPFVDRGAFLPGLATATDGPGFWAHVDCCSDDPDYGAQSFMLGEARPHFWMGAADGAKTDFLRSRACERQFNQAGGGKASTVFDCVGAAQVAKASFSGMRLLHRLRESFAVWPFDQPAGRTVVEIYTRAMLRHAGGRGTKLRDTGSLNRALATLGSDAALEDRLTDHETNSLVAAAALRQLAADPRWWRPAGMTAEIARTEGWTFGIG